MKRILPVHRKFSTSNIVFAWKDKFIFESDLNKKPSEVEIRKKGLPKNTQTTGKKIEEIKEVHFM